MSTGLVVTPPGFGQENIYPPAVPDPGHNGIPLEPPQGVELRTISPAQVRELRDLALQALPKLDATTGEDDSRAASVVRRGIAFEVRQEWDGRISVRAHGLDDVEPRELIARGIDFDGTTAALQREACIALAAVTHKDFEYRELYELTKAIDARWRAAGGRLAATLYDDGAMRITGSVVNESATLSVTRRVAGHEVNYYIGYSGYSTSGSREIIRVDGKPIYDSERPQYDRQRTLVPDQPLERYLEHKAELHYVVREALRALRAAPA